MKTMAGVIALLLLLTMSSVFAEGVVSLGDTVWVNYNGDANKDADEPGIPGATVTLEVWYNDGWLLYPTVATTDANGWYSFTGLTPGNEFRTTVVLPAEYADYAQNYDLDGVLDKATSHVVSTDDWTFDFGFVPPDEQGEPAIELLKTGATTSSRGATITYHFVATNTGNVPLSDVVVNDPMLGGVIWGPGSLEAGQRVEFDVTYKIPITGDLTTGTPGTATNVQILCITPPPPPPPPPPCEEKFTNTATAYGTWNGQTVSDTSSWEVQVITYASPAIDLLKTGPSTALRGQTITYHFRVQNTGTSGLDITVNDPMLGGDVWSKTGVPAGEVNTFDITYRIPLAGDLKLGTAGPVTNVQTLCYGYYPPPTCYEKLVNTATATGVAPCGTVTDTSTWTVTVSGTVKPGVDLVKSGPATAKRGDTITYRFKVTNTGTATETVTVNDPLLGGVIWTKSGVKPGEVNEFTVTYKIPLYGDLRYGTRGAVVALCYTTYPTCGQTLVNTATATASVPWAKAYDTASCTTTVGTSYNSYWGSWGYGGSYSGSCYTPVMRGY